MKNTLIQILRIGVLLALAYTLFTLVRTMLRWKRIIPASRSEWIYLLNEFAFLALAAVLLVIIHNRYQEPMDDIMRYKGKTLPAFRYSETRTGQLQQLDTGNLVLLNIWATWCGPCRIEMPELERLHQKYPKVRVVALTDESASTVRTFLEKHPYSFKTGSFEPGAKWLETIPTRPVSILIVDGRVKDAVIGARGLAFFQNWVKPYL
jgi:thiol-disulfide isomerase/thioredoxin